MSMSEAVALKKLIESKDREINKLKSRLESDRDLHVTTRQLENEVKLLKSLIKESNKEYTEMSKAIAEYDRRVDEFTTQHDLTLLKDQEISKLQQELQTLQKLFGEKDRALVRVDRDPQHSRRMEAEHQALQEEVQTLRKDKKLTDKHIRTQQHKAEVLEHRLTYVTVALKRCGSDIHYSFPADSAHQQQQEHNTQHPQQQRGEQHNSANSRSTSPSVPVHSQRETPVEYITSPNNNNREQYPTNTDLHSPQPQHAQQQQPLSARDHKERASSSNQQQQQTVGGSSTSFCELNGTMVGIVDMVGLPSLAQLYPVGGGTQGGGTTRSGRSTSPSSIRSPCRSPSATSGPKPPWQGPLESPRRSTSPNSSWARRKSYGTGQQGGGSRCSTPPTGTNGKGCIMDDNITPANLANVLNEVLTSSAGCDGGQHNETVVAENKGSQQQQQSEQPQRETPTRQQNTPTPTSSCSSHHPAERSTTPPTSKKENSNGNNNSNTGSNRQSTRTAPSGSGGNGQQSNSSLLNQDCVTSQQYNALQREYIRSLKAMEEATYSVTENHSTEVNRLQQEIARLDSKYRRDIHKLKHELVAHRKERSARQGTV